MIEGGGWGSGIHGPSTETQPLPRARPIGGFSLGWIKYYWLEEYFIY